MSDPNDIISALDHELLAQAYEEVGVGEGPYHSYARLAREGRGAFTLCSLRAIARARLETQSARDVQHVSKPPHPARKAMPCPDRQFQCSRPTCLALGCQDPFSPVELAADKVARALEDNVAARNAIREALVVFAAEIAPDKCS